MFEKYYLAYGSNLNLTQMKYRCPKATPIGTVLLKNYRLVYKGQIDNHAFLTIEESEGSKVPLGLYKLTILDIKSLDRYEGYPDFYSKCYINVEVENKIRKALIYIMNPSFKYHKPSKRYVEICMKGYEDFNFNKAILEQALTDTKSNMPKKKILTPEEHKKDD